MVIAATVIVTTSSNEPQEISLHLLSLGGAGVLEIPTLTMYLSESFFNLPILLRLRINDHIVIKYNQNKSSSQYIVTQNFDYSAARH